jgi:hypothetical protein
VTFTEYYRNGYLKEDTVPIFMAILFAAEDGSDTFTRNQYIYIFRDI